MQQLSQIMCSRAPGRWRTLAVLCLAVVGALAQGSRLRSRQRDAVEYTFVVLENGGNAALPGWDVYDTRGPGTLASEPEPGGKDNRVVVFRPEDGTSACGFRLTLPEDQQGCCKLQWRMKFTSRYTIYVQCETSAGKVYVQYAPGDEAHSFVEDRYSRHALGGETGMWKWATVRRDIQADLWAADPEIELQAVHAIMVRGSGMVDDIRVYDYRDQDHDLLPDAFEEQRKLNPKDANDATPRLIEQVIELTAPAQGKGEPKDGQRKSRKAKRQRYRVVLNAAERQGLETYFEERLGKRLAQAPKPEKGRVYHVRLRAGGEIVGRLEKFAAGRITLRTQHGTLVMPIHRVSRQDTLSLFPREAARQMAMRDVQKRVNRLVESKIEAAEAVAEQPVVTPAVLPDAPVVPAEDGVETAEETQEPPPVLRVATRVGRPKYDVRRAPTPAGIKPVLQAFAEWLKTQHRRVGGRVGIRLYAKEQNGNVVLYLVMAPTFLAQDYDLRHRMAVGIQQFWAFRCQGMGVADLNSAHLVMVSPEGRVVGGSRPDDPADVWVAE